MTALRANGGGDLYSSDFPYFRIANPEKYIGCVVPEDLKDSHWHLFVKGDRKNLKKILTSGQTFDLIHYDSDKQRRGRQFFHNAVRPAMSPGAVFVMDDVNDDLFFRDVVVADHPGAKVFLFEGKFVGVSGM